METIKKEFTIYKFNELSETAKELSIELKDFNPQESKAIIYVIKEINIIINKYE